MMMLPGLTEDEFQRYQELLEIKCQYERHKQQTNKTKISRDDAEVQGRDEEEVKDGEREGGEQGPLSSSVVDVNCNTATSEHEIALIEEELRHLEFKCRNILRAQKMQQLRERCLKAWMMEEETVAAGPEPGNHEHKSHNSAFKNHDSVCLKSLLRIEISILSLKSILRNQIIPITFLKCTGVTQK